MGAQTERLWYLRRLGSGWTASHVGCHGKKWDNHRSKLLKDGLLEKDENGMSRVTDAGRAALGEQQ